MVRFDLSNGNALAQDVDWIEKNRMKKLLLRLFSVVVLVGLVLVTLTSIPGVTAQDATSTSTPTLQATPLPACQLYHLTVDNGNVRECAGLNCALVSGVSSEDVLCIRGVADTPGWLLIDLQPEDPASDVGYVSQDIVAPGLPGVSDVSDCEIWEVTVPQAAMRLCPGAGCGVVAGLPQGTQMCVITYGGEYEDWLYAAYTSIDETTSGWVSASIAVEVPDSSAVQIPTPTPQAGSSAVTVSAQQAPASSTPTATLPVCPTGTAPQATVDVFGEQATPDQSAGEAVTPLSCITATPTPILAAGPLIAASGPFLAQNVALSSLRVGNIELSSPQGSAQFRFQIPSNWKADGNSILYLNMEYFETVPVRTEQDSLRDLISLLNVKVDGELAASITLSDVNIGQQTVPIPLSAEILADPEQTSHRIEITLIAQDHCLADAISRLFIRSDLSYFHFEYHEYFPALDLAMYPQPFYNSSFNVDMEPVFLVLPDEPTVEDIQAAASVSAGLGQLSFNGMRVHVVNAAELTEAVRRDNNLILIGQIGQHSLIDALYAADVLPTHLTSEGEMTVNGLSVEEGDGIVQLITHPENQMRAIATVTGRTSEGLFKAVKALSGPPSILGLGGPLALIADTRPVVRAEGSFVVDTVTFSDLGVSDLTMSGIGTQVAEVQFHVPSGAVLTPDAEIDLIFSYSEALADGGSTITLLLNEKPLASNFLRSHDTPPTSVSYYVDEQGRYHLKAGIPQDSIIPGVRNSLSLVLDVRGDWNCDFPEPLVTWFNVHGDSELSLPRQIVGTTMIAPMLSWFPGPFNSEPDLSNVLVSLPEEPTGEDLEQAMRLITRLASETSGGEGFVPRINLGELDEGIDLTEYHLLVLGRPSTNSLLAGMNEILPQPFVPGTDELQQTLDDVTYRLPPGYDVGVLEIFRSPWSEDRMVVVISGSGQRGQLNATNVLAEDIYGRDALMGDVAFVSDTAISVVDTRLFYSAGEELAFGREELVTESAIAALSTSTPVPVYTVTQGPTPTATATATPTPVMSPTPIFTFTPAATEPTAIPPLATLAADLLEPPTVSQPVWVDALLVLTGFVLVAMVSYGLIAGLRAIRGNDS